MAKYKKEEALKIFLEAAKNYEESYGENILLYFIKKNVVKYVEVGFRDLNFLHLTGVKSHLSAQLFYSSCYIIVVS